MTYTVYRFGLRFRHTCDTYAEATARLQRRVSQLMERQPLHVCADMAGNHVWLSDDPAGLVQAIEPWYDAQTVMDIIDAASCRQHITQRLRDREIYGHAAG